MLTTVQVEQEGCQSELDSDQSSMVQSVQVSKEHQEPVSVASMGLTEAQTSIQGQPAVMEAYDTHRGSN